MEPAREPHSTMPMSEKPTVKANEQVVLTVVVGVEARPRWQDAGDQPHEAEDNAQGIKPVTSSRRITRHHSLRVISPSDMARIIRDVAWEPAVAAGC